MRRVVWVCLPFGISSLLAQAPVTPVIGPRGITNAFTLSPAPATVGAGGIIWINGLNLGPAAGVTAQGPVLPTTLGDPPIQVLINNTPAPLYSATPGRIAAQVPWNAAGMVQVVVKRGDAVSRPARINVNAVFPALRSANDKGYGEVRQLSNDGATMKLTATGLGQTNPRAVTGTAGPADGSAQPTVPLRAYVGGLPANVSAALSAERVGEFDIQIDIPAGAQPGDIVTVAGSRAAPPLLFGTIKNPVVTFLPLPDGAPEIRALTGSDLRGGYAMASGARDSNGCYPSVLFDLPNHSAARLTPCLTGANRNAVSPVVRVNEGSALAALVGPAPTDTSSGVSSAVAVFNPGSDAMTVQLPAPALTLGSAAGELTATLAGTPPKAVRINTATGEVSDLDLMAGGGGGGGGGLLLGNFNVDLGDGLKHVLSITPAGQTIYAVVGDDADAPKAAKLAVLNTRGEVTATRDFPAGWLPLLAAKAPTSPGGGGPGAAFTRPRGSATYDATTRTLFVLSRAADLSGDAIVGFGPGESTVAKIPDGWFIVSCTAAVPIQQLTLSRRFALLGSNSLAKDFNAACPASGFLLFDFAAASVEAIPLPGDGQMLATAANSEINDYLYGTNIDASRQAAASTVYVLDGVTRSAFRMDLPAGIAGFTALQEVPETTQLIALGRNRVAGDAGLIVFDIESGIALPPFPTPEGFATMQVEAVFPATRKVVARGVRADGSGSQFLIYDLLSGDLQMAPNPAGAAYAGPPPATANAAALLSRDVKANAITAVTYDADKKQNGVMLLRIP